MPSIAVSANVLPDGLAAIIVEASATPAASAGNAGGGGFLALLQTADIQPGTSGNIPAAPAQPQNSNNNQNNQSTQNSPTAPANISSPVASNASSGNAPEKSGNNATDNNAAASKNTANANSSSGANNTKQPAQQPAQQSPSGQPLSPAAQKTAATTGQNTPPSNNTQTPDELRQKLSQQLSAINQILASLLQAMMGAAPVVPVQQLSLPQGGANIINGSQPASSPTDATSLLKDMQSLIDQLQQMLQQGSEAGAATATTPDDTQIQAQLQGQVQTGTQGQTGGQSVPTLQQLIDALQTDSATLTQILKSQNAGNGLPSALSNSLLNASVLPQADTASLVSSIAQVKDQLQQLQAVNSAQLLKAQADFAAQFTQTVSTFADTAGTQSGNAPTGTNTGTGNGNAVTGTDNANNTTVAQISVSLPANTAAGTVIVAPVVAGQGGTGSSAGDNSGGSQNQPMPLPSIAGVGQSAPTSSVSTVSFASVLNQASAPSSLLGQVTFNIKTALNDGSSKIHIQLDPVDLGKLDIQLNVGADGKTGVAITADNKNTLALLQRDTAGLMRALSDAGLSTSSGNLSFSLGGGGQQFAGGQQPASQAAATYQNTQPQEDDTAIPVISRSYVVSLTQGLDITI